MKRKINFIEIAIFTAIALFITSQVLPKEVNNLDEIWNFNFANCIANGLVPYKDFNIIQGPLTPLICSMFLKIFGQEMIVMRFIAIIVDSIVLFMVYKIMSNLQIKQYLKYVILIILAYIAKPYFTIDYNWMTLLNVLIIIYIEIKQKDETKLQKHLLIGFIAGISITIKQTVGLVIAMGTIGYKMFEARSIDEFKGFMKIAIIRAIGVIIAPLTFVLILFKLGAINEYIDYCILGVATFSNRISYLDGLIKSSNIIIRVLSLILPIVYLSLAYMYKIKQKKEMLILLIFSVIQLILIYPISDESHFIVAIPPTLISIGYILNRIFEKINVPQKEEIIAVTFLESLIIVVSIWYLLVGQADYNSKNKNMELQHFKYLPMSQNGIESVKEIEEFIESQKNQVIILDATAALYMIPINRYNKNYDMFLNGNLGSRGEDGQIEDLNNMKEKTVLIMNDNYRRNWQNPENVRNYIKTKMTKTGEIGIFDIYEE